MTIAKRHKYQGQMLTAKQIMAASGRSERAVYDAIHAGTLHLLGEEIIGRPVIIDGTLYPSMRAAARGIGASDSGLRRAVMDASDPALFRWHPVGFSRPVTVSVCKKKPRPN